MPGTILILSATGKTGRRLVPLLDGYDVRAASRSGADCTVFFDWEKPETYDATLSGIDLIYLIPPDIADPTPVTGPFLVKARQADVKRIVLLSSLGVMFPDEPPQSGRRLLESQVMDSGVAWTILRPSSFNQNFSEGFLLPGILQGHVVVSSTGEGKAAFVDAEDTAAVAASALIREDLEGEILARTGPEALNFAEAAAVISKAAGRKIGYHGIRPEEFRNILLGVGAAHEYAEIPVRDQRAIRAGHGAAISDTVENIAGRPPRSFDEFARGAADAWR